MKKLMMTTLLTASAAAAFAMPTKDELQDAKPLVVELMAPSMSAYDKAKYKEKVAAAAKVGDTSVEFAKSAESEAAKFLLLKGAVNYYVRGEQYDKAAEALSKLQREIKDVPADVVFEISEKATRRISESKAPALYSVYRSSKLKSKAANNAKTLAEKLKKVQSDALRREYAEALAISGDWNSAYAEFAKVGDAKLQKLCADVAAAKVDCAAAGEYWWTYEPATDDAEDFFKAHAAAFYSLALDTKEISGLKNNLFRQRIASIPESQFNGAFPPMGYGIKGKGDIAYELRIMDIAPDGGFSWTYTDKEPDGGMEAFSQADYPENNLLSGKSPLSAENGWENGKAEYWVRKEFTYPVASADLTGGRLLVHPTRDDKTVEVWLNGKKIYGVGGDWHYFAHQLDIRGIKPGRNVLAVHATKNPNPKTGYLDLGLYLTGKGLYGYAKLYADKERSLIPVDEYSIKEENIAVKDAMHGGAEWKYTVAKPTDNWFASEFDDAAWSTGKGAFGGGTLPELNPFPDHKYNTKWETDNIWMRTTFDYAGDDPSDISAAILSFSKGECEKGMGKNEKIIVYLNGKKIHENVCLAKSAQCCRPYIDGSLDVFDLTEKVRPALVKGKNVLAAYACVKAPGLSYWSRFVDVGLYIK